MTRSNVTYHTVILALLASAGCASVPSERYGVHTVTFEGVEEMDPAALNACLATAARPRLTITLGTSGTPSCGQPPFDANPWRIRLWRWPWTDWPLFDEIVFEHDLERMLRWYRARGYYDARVVRWYIDPPSAMASDTVEEDTDCERRRDDQGCVGELTIEIYEGEPVLVSELSLTGVDELAPELVAEIEESMLLIIGERFDEALYDDTKAAITTALVEASYARAEVIGHVEIDEFAHTARVEVRAEIGPSCVFGAVRVEGQQDLQAVPIRQATRIDAGDVFSTSALRDAQAAVYDLNALASVNVRPVVPTTGNVVDVVVDVVPAQRMRFQLGAGVQSGVVQQGSADDVEEVPQWDLHTAVTWEHRNLFGGLRRLRIDERPGLVFTSSFPSADDPRFGNLLAATFAQPAFIDPRTTFKVDAQWEVGPDPFLAIFRHELEGGLSLERYFFRHAFYGAVGMRENLYLVPGSPEPEIPGTTVPASSDLLYLEQLFRLDLRDIPVRTRSGLYASLSMQEAGFFLPSSWSYFRIVPDVRGYIPLPLGMVVLARFALGALLLDYAEPGLDDLSRQLGPTTTRFRGGGGTANRGFLAGELGDGPNGGIRRWLASVELRIPVTRNFSLGLFTDAGDVNSEAEFRFDHPQMSVGLGFRLLTLIGPIRLDFGWRVPKLQVLADEDGRDPGGTLRDVNLGLFSFPGAVNLTLGDPF